MSEHVRWERRCGLDSETVRVGYEGPSAPTSSARPCAPPAPARHVPTELAERAGMTQFAVSRLETGRTMPTIGVLERLAPLAAQTSSRPGTVGVKAFGRRHGVRTWALAGPR